jgi:hypothetical protein
MEGDATYFARRASEERAAAVKALHPTARRCHLELASRYDELAGMIVSRPAMSATTTGRGKGQPLELSQPHVPHLHP